MRRLTERTEIAKAINFGKYPVIKIDLADRDEHGVKGTKVNIDFGGEFFIHAKIRSYNDKKYLKISQGGTMLSASTGYSDYIEMLEYANAPTIKADQEIVVVMIDSEKKDVYAPAIIKTGKRIDKFCSTPLDLEKLYVE